MESLTALSLAYSILQIISFSQEALTVAKCIARDGSPDVNLAENVAQLSSLSRALEGELPSRQGRKPLTESQRRLKEVAQKCLKSSNDLTTELDKIKWKPDLGGGGSEKERRVFSQTWKFWWAKSRIERLQKEMREVEQTMQSSILADWWLSKEAAFIQQEGSFKSLDIRLQWFISQYAQGNRKLSDLVISQVTAVKDEVSSENIKTGNQITSQLQYQESPRLIQEQRDRLLGSLAYDTMTTRKSRVTISHGETFHWIFDNTIAAPWNSFSEWLKSDDQIYWVSGKPGSGKSTLMKFLVDDCRTLEALRERGAGATVVSFFLWNAGTPVQRSIQGLLSALLHQIISTNPELIPYLLAERPELSKKATYSQWSDEELELVLSRSISMSPQPLCIFLDGLDEIDRDKGVVDLIDRLRSNTTAKFCVSSRPEVEFKDAFGGYPMLRLQDLTAKDISDFVNDFLQKNFQFSATDGGEVVLRQSLIDSILERAEGVFLWVHLVLRSLRRGSVHIDSYEQLSERITRVPRNLEELYTETWKRHGEDENLYRAQAGRYFKLVLEASNISETVPMNNPFSTFEFAIASSNTIQKTLGGGPLPSMQLLVEEIEGFCRRIEDRCGGLLEIFSYDQRHPDAPSSGPYAGAAGEDLFHQFIIPLSVYVDPRSGETGGHLRGGDLAALWNLAHNSRLGFIHRTAADFLLHTKSGRDIIDSDTATSADIRVSMIRSRFIRTLVFKPPPYGSLGILRRYVTSRPCDLFSDHQNLCRDIPNELECGLLIQLEHVYERLFDRTDAIDYIITQLRFQVLNGRFDAPYYKMMCDFIMYRAKSLQYIYMIVSNIPTGTASRAFKKMDAIKEACFQIVANHALNMVDLLHNVNWPLGVPKFPVPRCLVLRSSDLMGNTFANVFSLFWIVLDAINYLRKEAVSNISLFLLATSVAEGGGALQRCIKTRPKVYARIKGFKESLLFAAAYRFGNWRWRNHETICWLLEEGADANCRRVLDSYGGQQLTPFELFLLSVPRMQSPAEASRIAAIMRAYINAGASLDHVVCLSRSARRFAACQPFETVDAPRDREHKIVIESNVCQLVRDTMALMADRLAKQDLDIQVNLDDIVTEGYKGYRKVLCVRKAAPRIQSQVPAQFVAASSDDSERILEFLDSESVPGQWKSEAELQSLLERIIQTGKEVRDINSWMSKRGHTFERTDATAYSLGDAKSVFEALFPYLAYEDE